MDEDILIDLWLAGQGISPQHPNYAAAKAALKADAATKRSLQGRQQTEDTRRWDANFGQTQAKIDREYQIAIRAAESQDEINQINRWKAEKDYEISQGRLNLDTELGRGRLELDRGTQGLNLLKTDVDLRNAGPKRWTSLADWEAGVAANPNAPAFLQSLLANTGASAGGSTPGMVQKIGMPEANSLSSVLASMGVGQAASDQTNAAMQGATTAAASGGGGAKPEPTPQAAAIQAIVKNWEPSGVEGWDPKDVAALRSIGALAALGEQKYANRFAQLDEMDQDVILGAQGRIGRDPNRVARNLERFRVGQAVSGSAA